MDSLFSMFQGSSLKEWKDKLQKDLKGVSFEDLIQIDNNQIAIAPFYNKENSSEPTSPTFNHADWEIATEIIAEDAKAANQLALNALNKGASSLIFVFHPHFSFNFDLLLKDIQLNYIETTFVFHSENINSLPLLVEYLNQNLEKEKRNQAIIKFDAIAECVQSGSQEWAQEKWLQFFSETQGYTNIVCDAAFLQNAGATSLSQLAGLLAQLNEYLNLLEQKGLLTNDICIQIQCAAGTQFFEEIAKFRALHILLANLFKAFHIQPKWKLFVETSGIYKAHKDIYNNILRDSVSGMAAVFGGCNTLLIRNYDSSIQEHSEFSERIARNQQLIFKEESYFNKIADAGSGSYFIESLTQELVEKAWELFVEIESRGGWLADSKSGILAAKIQEEAKILLQEYKEGKRSLIGVNKYLNKMENEIPSPIVSSQEGAIKPIRISTLL